MCSCFFDCCFKFMSVFCILFSFKKMNRCLSKQKKTFYYCVLLLLLIFPIKIFAQTNNNLGLIVNNFLNRNNNYDEVVEFVNQHSISQDIIEIQNYLTHEDDKLRAFLYGVLFKMISNESDLKSRQDGVYLLVKRGLFDSDVGNIYRVLNYLSELPEEYFDGKTKNLLSTLVLESPPHYSKLLRLIGQVNVIQLQTYLEVSLQNDKELTASDIWNINLVLARWGDEDRAEYCVGSVKSLGLNDEIVFRLVPDLIYTRQRVVFNYLFDEILKSELNCTSTDPDHEIDINCAYRLLEFVAPHISDFPLRITASGELDFEDYEEALLNARVWIESNKDTYRIISDK